MKNYYYYLIASLPMLQLGMKPPFSHKEFLKKCRGLVSDGDMGFIEKEIEDRSAVLKEWNRFDKCLRNELVKYRAVKRQKDPEYYINKEVSFDPFIAALSHLAVKEDSPLDAELYLDRVRWDKLDELEIGHYFDIDYLVIYGLKIKILERWFRINSGSGMDVLEDMLGAGNR